MIRIRRRRGPSETTRLGPYELRVEVLHAGTRSEGRIGRLYEGDREIRGSRPGETIVVDQEGPVLVYLGDERPHLWSVSGWTLDPGDQGCAPGIAP